jgi:hypothetical protein
MRTLITTKKTAISYFIILRTRVRRYLGEGHDITAQMNAALKGAEAKMGKNRGKQRPKTAKK